MQPLKEFAGLDQSFWAHVKMVSERLGYSKRNVKGEMARKLRRYTVDGVVKCLKEAVLSSAHIQKVRSGNSTEFGETLCSYLNRRAELLERRVAPDLMDRKQAAAEFSRLRKALNPRCALPMNKQKGEKRHHAYMVGMVNMLTEKTLGRLPFDDEPRGLTIVTKGGKPLRVLSRWMDGAYPSRIDPYAVWEVKEYYGTTTFGSRVADGVYETMLDGLELMELKANEGRKIRHYLMVDDRFTWWDCGRSYLCRIVDMLHVGLVDEVLFGKEVLRRWPQIVKEWP